MSGSDFFIDNTLEVDKPMPTGSASPKERLQINRLTYDGRGGHIFQLWLMNAVMKMITLGIYGFWGKTRMRRYIVSSFELGQDRFEYTGTGGELFKGFLKAAPILLLLYVPLGVAAAYAEEESLWPLLFFLPFYYIIGVAIYAATRYRLSRTTWRGIRGRMTGSALSYANLSFWRTIVNILSLGILIPYSDIKKYEYIVSNTWFGNINASFEGMPGELVRVHIVTLLLAIPTLGISRLWYHAALLRHRAAHTKIGHIGFRNLTTGMDLLRLIGGNLLLIIFTLGLGKAFIIHRNMRFFAAHNVVVGDLNTDAILQAAKQDTVIGEGLDDVLDLDTGFLG